MRTALLRLFNGIRVNADETVMIPEAVLERTVRHGYILSGGITPDMSLLDDIEQLIGISGEKANATFHKSWKIVAEADIEVLILQQIMHYITTYGFEALGVYDEDYIYIPSEQLDLPNISEDIRLVVIKAMSDEEILEKVLSLGNGVALADQTLDDLMEVIVECGFDASLIVENVKNRELKSRLYQHFGIVPSNPEEYLRYVVTTVTGQSLLIKNAELIEALKGANPDVLDPLLEKAPARLGEIFLRFKPLFLAMKKASRNKTFFNRLRKSADILHRPLPVNYINSVTSQIRQGSLVLSELHRELRQVPVFQRIKLAYALKYRLNSSDSIVYRVRNGKAWVTDFEWTVEDRNQLELAYIMTVNSVADVVGKNVDGETIYIPEGVCYTLPATEKQFIGNMPNGSYVSVPENLIVGIHWTDQDDYRVDLDYSVVDIEGKIGWDSAYRRNHGDILFSGDITAAPLPNGATELMYYKNGIANPGLLMVNYFNYNADVPVPCRLIAASEEAGNFGRNYMIDVNNIVASAEVKITRPQNVIGLVVSINGENRVYFSEFNIGVSITSSSGNPVVAKARDFLTTKLEHSISLEEVLVLSGASVVRERPDEGDYLDLSPEALDKTTILDLFKS